MIKAIFFDLDGTLLPMDEKEFTKIYLSSLAKKLIPYHYDPALLSKGVFLGLKKMVLNDGSRFNSDVFFDEFSSFFQRDTRKEIPVFLSFYQNEFKDAFIACKKSPLSREIVSFCKKNFPLTILSTNPIFPREAQCARLSFLDLADSDFDFVTDYSNSKYCKPNPNYFSFLLEKYSLKPEEVLLFGNDVIEDYACATKLGIQVFLLNHSPIVPKGDEKEYPWISMEEVIPVISKCIQK